MENYKKEIWNNCQNDITPLKISNTITNNLHETASTFNDYFLTVADNVIRNIKKDNNPRDNKNPPNYLINSFTAYCQELIGPMSQFTKLIILSNP